MRLLRASHGSARPLNCSVSRRMLAPVPHLLALLATVSASLWLAGCSTLGESACTSGERASIAEVVYFGANKPGGIVSPEEWSTFLREVVTPRFPAGLAVWQASGQWQGGDGTLTKENTFVLSLVHTQESSLEASVRAIISEYKARFHQEAVLRVKSHVCISL
jgi:uncharacterized protein DUF3574